MRVNSTFLSRTAVQIWRRSCVRQPQCLCLTVKHQTGLVIVWGTIWFNGVVTLHVVDNKKCKKDNIQNLDMNLKKSVRKMKLGRT